jgi:hypothetical protein
MVNNVNADYISVLNQQGVLSFVPSGNSMWPFIKNRKQTVIVKKSDGEIHQNDVVFFRRQDGTCVLHRVLQVYPDYLVVRGDSQINAEKVQKETVFGILEGFYKGKKYIPVTDKKYQKKVCRWCKNSFITRMRKKFFYFKNRVKNHFKRG